MQLPASFEQPHQRASGSREVKQHTGEGTPGPQKEAWCYAGAAGEHTEVRKETFTGDDGMLPFILNM